ncbi:MAG: endonuclease Q family protein [Firmicutes bacterium]|nr:endonuclease Q family protein [Bacillota bacterium]MDD4264065.1 endonuclease Q family protein [Bacillota bacterium]MDD4693618.1 endonuclease Q family protein [Bacillota bacterium]
MKVYADLHVHIGKAQDRFVKITASKTLTLKNALSFAKEIKGIDVLGVVDCGSRLVTKEIVQMLDRGDLIEIEDGGLLTKGGLLLILGWEIELLNTHFLIYVSSFSDLKVLTEVLWPKTKNQELSTQRYQIHHQEVREVTELLGGLFFPAHAFTPYKGLYGKAVDSLYELFDKPFTAIEMGLSSSTEMIAGIKELEPTTFLANSDAHSLQKIGREYNEIEVNSLSFAGLKEALEKEKIVANYGLDPRLGKYHETGCLKCGSLIGDDGCTCGSLEVKGVKPRLEELGGYKEGRKRPPYIKQIPLEFLPQIGPKTITKLYELGTEIEILNTVPIGQIEKVTNSNIAEIIAKSRTKSQDNNLQISSGKAGIYGKVSL